MTADNTLAVTAPDLIRLLSNLKPFASNDDLLPSLNGIRLSADGELLEGRASDRYKLGIDRCEAQGHLPPTTVQLASVSRLLVLLKGSKRLVELTREDDALIVNAGRERYVLDVDKGEFPDMAKVVNQWRDDRSAQGAGIDPVHLKAFTHLRAAEMRATMRIWLYGPTRPIHVKIGEHFHGVLMPVRLQEGELVIPARESAEAAA